MTYRVCLLMIPLAVILVPLTVFGNGKMKGIILDKETRTPLIGVNVVLVGTTYGAASGQEGEFDLLNVPEGTYSVRASMVGYSATTVENVQVDLNLTTEITIELTPAQISMQPVVITAERPLVNKNSTNAVRIITSNEASTLAIRGVDNIIALQAGVVLQDGAIHLRGGRVEETGVQVDGITVNDPVSGGRRLIVVQDAVQEIVIQSSGYEAEFGRANSGIVQYILKTGGPAFKGTLEYVTDNIGFQSAGSFSNGTKRLGAYWYGYNEFTGTASGPLVDERFKYFGMFNYFYQRDKMPQAYSGVDIGAVKDPVSGDSVFLAYPAGVLLKNSDEKYTGTATFSADLLPLKLRFSGSFTKFKYFNGNILRMFDLERTPENDMWQWYGSAKGSYTFSPRMFGEITFGLFKNFAKVLDPVLRDNFLIYGDSVLNAQAGYVWDHRPGISGARYTVSPAYNIYDWPFTAPGVPVSTYSKNQRDNVTVGAALTAQIGRNHTFKLGGDLVRYTIRSYGVSGTSSIASLVANIDDTLPEYGSLISERIKSKVSAWGYDTLGNEIGGTGIWGARHPLFGSAYIQDKMEFGDLVMNVGIRYDYIDPDSYQLLDPSHPELAVEQSTLAILPDGLVHSRPRSVVTPRFGAAFSLSENTVFHAQFAELVQQSRMLDSYQAWRLFAVAVSRGGLAPTILGPVQTTQYEAGISQPLGSFASLDVTAYYKDVYDQTKQQAVVTAPDSYPPYYVYVNGDYSTTKGVEITFQMRRIRRLQASATVTLQDAQGSGSFSNPFQQSYGLYQQMIVPLDYNNSVKGSAFVDYRFGTDEGGSVFSGVGANLLLTFSSGHPYTMLTSDNSIGKPLEALNRSTTPSWFQADLRVEKTFHLADNILSTAYVSVINLFDTRNVNNVWPWTGSDATDGWLAEPTTGEKMVESSGRIYADLYRQLTLNYYQPYVDLYTSYRYGPPRQVRVGVRLEY